jgi:hypothetical protein
MYPGILVRQEEVDSSRIGTPLSGWRPNAWDEEFSLWNFRRIGSLLLQGLVWTYVLDVVTIQSESSCQAHTGSDINRVVVFHILVSMLESLII